VLKQLEGGGGGGKIPPPLKGPKNPRSALFGMSTYVCLSIPAQECC